MRFFKTADGRYINPDRVSYFEITGSFEIGQLWFYFQGPSQYMQVYFNDYVSAKQELDRFIEFCDGLDL